MENSQWRGELLQYISADLCCQHLPSYLGLGFSQMDPFCHKLRENRTPGDEYPYDHYYTLPEKR
jgi:hypothetical protein